MFCRQVPISVLGVWQKQLAYTTLATELLQDLDVTATVVERARAIEREPRR